MTSVENKLSYILFLGTLAVLLIPLTQFGNIFAQDSASGEPITAETGRGTMAIAPPSNWEVPSSRTHTARADSPPPSRTDASSLGCRLLPVASVRASGGTIGNPSNVADNNFGTSWTEDGSGTWIRFNLGESKNICDVSIAWHRGSIRSYDFTISVSANGINYYTVYSGRSHQVLTNQYENYNFADTFGRYMKISVYGNNENNFASIKEIRIHGH